MRHTLILVLAAGVACAKTDQPQTADTTAAVTPPAVSLADVAGTWDGKTMAVGNDSVLTTWQLTATTDTSGWSQTVGASTTVIPVRVVSISGDSMITEAGPFPSVLRPGQQVTTRTIYRLQNGKLIGVIHATYPNGEMVMLRSEATRK